MRNRTKSAVLGLAVLMSGLLPAPGDPAALVARTAAELPRWIAGCWSGSRGAERFSERWVVAGNTLLGVAHTLKGSTLSAFEFLRVVVRGDELVYIAQPGGAPPTEFVAAPADQSASAITFANPKHDFPKRVGYRMPGPEALTAWIDGGAGGKAPRIEFVMTKANCEP
jgi:hypothetical protein